MSEFYVIIEETAKVTYWIEADSKEDAKNKLLKGEGEEVDRTFHGSSNPTTWPIEEVNE